MLRLRSLCFQLRFRRATPGAAGAASVTYLQTDTTTLGNWKGVYGQDGNVIAQHSIVSPPYSSFNTGGAINLYLLDLWATDPRALLKQYFSYSATERIESYFHTITSMDFLLNRERRAKPPRGALFCRIMRIAGRSVTVQALDSATNAVLDSRSLPNYQAGVYLVYNYSGNVTFRVINNNPGQFSPPPAASTLSSGAAAAAAGRLRHRPTRLRRPSRSQLQPPAPCRGPSTLRRMPATTWAWRACSINSTAAIWARR